MSCSCGCCAGTHVHGAADTVNAPGQSSLRQRIGDHESFLAAMIDGLSDPALPALAKFRTRVATDASVALLDAGATMLDVLTFYRERIANEGYLRTATERRSLLELARLVAYRPRPGVAASTFLAFTVEQGHRLTIPVGTKALSVPGQDELPQTFETSEPLEARAEWSQLAIRRTRPQIVPAPNAAVGPGGITLWLKGTNTGLRKNDPLLVQLSAAAVAPQLYRVAEVNTDQIASRTRVTATRWLSLAFGREVRLIVASSALAAGPIAATDAGGRVLELLKALLDELSVPDNPQAALRFLTRKGLPGLRSELAGLPRSATRIRPWLNALVSSLESAEADGIAELEKPKDIPETRYDLDAATSAALHPQAARGARASMLQRSRIGSLDTHNAGALNAFAAFQPGLRDVLPSLIANAKVAPQPELRVYALRVRAQLFGHNATPKLTGFDAVTKAPEYVMWGIEHMREAEQESILHLDARQDAVTRGSWVVVDASSVTPTELRFAPQIAHYPQLIARVTEVRTGESRTAYGITAPTTTISIDSGDGEPVWLTFPAEAPAVNSVFVKDLKKDPGSEGAFDIIRRTSVFAGSELLELDETPFDKDLCDGADDEGIELGGLHLDLKPGRWVIVSGERADVKGTSGIQASELRLIAGVRHDVARDAEGNPLPGESIHTVITLASSLAYCYKRSTVTVWGNVVHATHGEIRHEVLGSGQGAQAFQQFTLRASPLTHVSAPNASGTASTLELRVNEVRWREVSSLAAASPTDHVYVASTSNEGVTTVMTGDGVNGARLPSGRDNVRADYRTGIGRAANIGAGRISLLGTRPLGLKEVVNPLRAGGGANADSAEQIRRNAPLGLQALDRLVSLRDYADFARASAGIGKASAMRLTDGRNELVHVTIAAVDDAPGLSSSDVFQNLLSAFRQLGDRRQPVQLAVRELVLLRITARVRIAPDYRWDLVEPKIRQALLRALGFHRRDLGQSVHSSEVISVIAGVPGVAYVDLETFGGIPEFVADGAGGRRPITSSEIAAMVAARTSGTALPDSPCGWLPPFCPVVARAAGYGEHGEIVPAQLAILSAEAPEMIELTVIP